MGSAKLVTAEELEARAPDGTKTELVRGRLLVMSPSNVLHGHVSGTIYLLLRLYVDPRKLGLALPIDTGFVVARNPDTVLAPDAAFVSAARAPPGPLPEKYWDVIPDLVVEVNSPSDRKREVHAKAMAWLAAGVRRVWIVDPRTRTVKVYLPDGRTRQLGAEEMLDGEDVVPGFSIEIGELIV
jgi:Uma2 family endonuclease